jgi:type II secretory pathway component PulK
MVAALVCLLVVLIMGAALLRGLIVHQRQSRHEVQRVQALWLAESAVGRAVARLQADPSYDGETWEPGGDALDGDGAAWVRIDVEEMEGQAEQKRVRIEARWPNDPLYRSIHRKELIVPLKGSGDSP